MQKNILEKFVRKKKNVAGTEDAVDKMKNLLTVKDLLEVVMV